MTRITVGTYVTHKNSGHLARISALDGDRIVLDVVKGGAFDSEYLSRAAFEASYDIPRTAAEAPAPEFNDDTSSFSADARQAQKNFRDKFKQSDLFARVVRSVDQPPKLEDFVNLSGEVKSYMQGIIGDMGAPAEGREDAYAQKISEYATHLHAALTEGVVNSIKAMVGEMDDEDGYTEAVARELAHYINRDSVMGWIIQKYHDAINIADIKDRRKLMKLNKDEAKATEDYESLQHDTEVELARLKELETWFTDIITATDGDTTPVTDKALLSRIFQPLLADIVKDWRIPEQVRDEIANEQDPVLALEKVKQLEQLKDEWVTYFRMDNSRLFVLLNDISLQDNPLKLVTDLLTRINYYIQFSPEVRLKVADDMLALKTATTAEDIAAVTSKLLGKLQGLQADLAERLQFFTKKWTQAQNRKGEFSPTKDLPAARVKLISGKKLYDIGMGVWMQTEMANGLTKALVNHVPLDFSVLEADRLPQEMYVVVNRVGKGHTLKTMGDQAELYDISGDVNNPVMAVKPSLQAIVNSVIGFAKDADKVREVLASDPTAVAWLDKASKLLPFGHPRYVFRLNDDFANANTPMDVLASLYKWGETVKATSSRSESDLNSFKIERKPRTTDEVNPLFVPKRETLSEMAVLEADKPGYAEFFQQLRKAVVESLITKDFDTAEELLAGVDPALQELNKKSDMVAAKLASSEFIKLPDLKYLEPQQYLRHGVRGLDAFLRGSLGAADAFAKRMHVQEKFTSLATGADMPNILESNSLRQGQPVKLKSASEIYVVVSRDEENPLKYHLIPEASINTHDRVDLVTANYMDLVPLRVYKVEPGDVIEVAGSLAKVTDASSSDLGIVQATFKNLAEPVLIDLANTNLDSTLKEPYKLVQCARDGGWITPGEEINCPFHESAGYLAGAVPGFTPKKVTACMQGGVETQDPENEKKFRHEYEVEKITAAMNEITFEQVDPAVAPHVEVAEDFDGELEIGATVRKFGSTITGTVVGMKQACLVVDWETAQGIQTETCWPQELSLTSTHADE